MKIKTYTAADMKGALRQIREEQGPDAVILSTRRMTGGVEVSVALESDPELAGPAAVVRDPAAPPAATAVPAEMPAAAPAAAEPGFGGELRLMRQLLESQLSQLAWSDLARRSPASASLLKELTTIGIAGGLATEILRDLPEGITPEAAHNRALATLSRRIRATGDELLDKGGRVAFVGPTGVGKTTGIAKLAARWVMRHGVRDIALVSMDDARFGAHEQLKVLGRLLGVECFAVEQAADLDRLLPRLRDHRLVLVDTAGVSPRDPEIAARAATLVAAAGRNNVDLWLTLSAGAQAGVIQDAMQAFAAFGPKAMLLTKFDEAACLGGILSSLATSGLPVAYVSTGSRIPQDLVPARAHQLVARAVFLAESSDASVGEELLVRRFGGVAHGIR